jgi:hypothetical protein
MDGCNVMKRMKHIHVDVYKLHTLCKAKNTYALA